ncbi:glutathione S-transferase family protein [Solirubrobacter ginsenosidimutans]|uniref:Glutathione S-transferase family protein n=1 Tax=Solirubrobacter ginsenosidimutans TaxID=490573 RepID=A0A9X3MUS8_9ACTN|nr:glutathione S-transferase family protein [Solirubrobacter ginsenosidimutans]MDA0162762.1 glutathione S-transferase family protein [Solirubrobacter ginsenosidimutans]
MRLYDYAASGNCFKVRLLLGLLGREYERVAVDIFAGDTLTDAFGALNPLRETPVLELSDGRRLTQSNAILWFLGEGTPFLPADPWERGLVASWLSFEQERVMGGIGGPRFRALTGRPFDAGRLDTGRGALAHLDDHLHGREWVVGGVPSIADLGLFPYVSVAGDAGLEHPPEVAAWLDRVRALPGFVDDFVTYPENARPGVARSIYDSMN